MARGKLFAKFDKFLNSSKSSTLKLQREAIDRGEIPHCASVGKIKSKDLEDQTELKKRLKGHGGKLRKFITVDNKTVLVCKRCEKELKELSSFIKEIKK